jgi:catalase
MAGDLSTQLVNALNDIHGVHEGHRAAHGKGICCSGTFSAKPEASDLTTAPHMQGEPVAATVRFSNGAGSPTRHDGARNGRGMATKFHLEEEKTTDIVALTLPAFFVRTPEDFLEFTRAQKPDPETGKPDLARIESFVAEHPETQLALGFSMFEQPPASYAQCRYNSIHAFKWVNAGGAEQFIRYRWEPQAGEANITEDESRGRERNYLQDEIRARLNGGPVVFDLHVQLAGDEDDPSDPTQPWPDERDVVHAGTLEITDVVADQHNDCEALIFDPTRVIDGIECSEDQILHARPGTRSPCRLGDTLEKLCAGPVLHLETPELQRRVRTSRKGDVLLILLMECHRVTAANLGRDDFLDARIVAPIFPEGSEGIREGHRTIPCVRFDGGRRLGQVAADPCP